MLESEKSPFIIEDLSEDPGFLLLQVSSLWAEYHDKAVKRNYDLSHMQFAVLASVHWLVLYSGKQVTQAILAHHTKITPMAISQMLKVLEAKGYVHRTTHLTDIRAKAVELTQQGKDLMDKAMKTIYDVDAKFFHVLGKDIKHFNRYMFQLLQAND